MPFTHWPAQIARLRMPAVGDTVNSDYTAVPLGAKAVTIFVPDMTGATPTLKMQSLCPTESVEYDPVGSWIWRDITVFDLTDGTFEALDAMPENTCVVVPASAFGGGNIRFVASGDQSAAPTTIHLIWNLD